MNDFLYVEKYAPKTVDELILPESVRCALVGYRDAGAIPNLILSSPPGTGKTSSILALAKELDLDILFVNSSNEGRYLNTIQNLVVDFVSTNSFYAKRKIVIFDEFDNTLPDVQLCLRGIIEQFQGTTAFVFTCNNYGKILEAIKSRCATLYYAPTKEETKTLMLGIFKRCRGILDAEGITYDPRILAELLKAHFPDNRKLINELQRYSVTGTLDIFSLSSVNNNNIDELMILMKDKRNYDQIRKWVAQNSDIDFGRLFRSIFDNLEKYVKPGSIAQAIILIGQYQYNAAFVADQEINTCALCLEITYTCEFI
jgi:DNA polymerase III delta prime subunit